MVAGQPDDDDVLTNVTPNLPVATLLDNEEGKQEDAVLKEELQRLCEQERNATQIDLELSPTAQETVISVERKAQNNQRMLWMMGLFVVSLIAAAIYVPLIVIYNRRSKSSFKCFDSLEELQEAVDGFVGHNETSCLELNQTYCHPLSTWCVSQVTNFSYLFSANRTPAMAMFNGPLDGWDTSNVTDMSYMFYDASAFNQSVSHFDVTKVTTI